MPPNLIEGWQVRVPEQQSSLNEEIFLHVDAKTALQLPAMCVELSGVPIDRNHFDCWGVADYRTRATGIWLLGHEHGTKDTNMVLDVVLQDLRVRYRGEKRLTLMMDNIKTNK